MENTDQFTASLSYDENVDLIDTGEAQPNPSQTNDDETERCNNIQEVNETTALLSNSEEWESRKKVWTGPPGFGARHMLAVMAFLGFVNVYCLRVNLSVALVAMVNTTGNKDNSTVVSDCPDPDGANSTSTNEGEFTWGSTLQGYVLGSFFYGYIVTQLPGGWLASKIGGKRLFGYGILCTSLLIIITPFAARYSIYLFIAIRVIEGIGEGVTFPAMHAMWGNWAPVWERSKLVGFTYAVWNSAPSSLVLFSLRTSLGIYCYNFAQTAAILAYSYQFLHLPKDL